MGEKVAEEGLEAKELDPPNLSATLPHLREPPGCGPSSGTMGSLGPHHLLSQGLSFPICIEGRLILSFPTQRTLSIRWFHKHSRPCSPDASPA